MHIKKLFSLFGKWVWGYKYFWTFFLFALIISVLDTNSLWRRYQIRLENEAIRQEI